MRAAIMLAVVMSGAVRALAAQPGPSPLEPYQMVRSLQLVQDRIADGDHAALPMQRKLLELIDARLRTAEPATFEDRRNTRALYVYAMSGGNPTTLQAVMSRLDLEGRQNDLGRGIASYVGGDYAAARDHLAQIDPVALSPDVGAFIALVKGMVLTPEEPAIALGYLDMARLLAPGTLVEESALRRSISLAATLEDPDRFLRASSQYVRRFLHSPYASQFAEAFVVAIVALRDAVDLVEVEKTIDGMNDAQAHVVYLRLARKSAIEGYKRLLEFASAMAAKYAAPNAENDPRAVLYASITSVTSDNVETVMRRLGEIDRDRLSAKDRNLLDAAKAVANEVMAGLEGGVDSEGAGAPAGATQTAAATPPPADSLAGNASDPRDGGNGPPRENKEAESEVARNAASKDAGTHGSEPEQAQSLPETEEILTTARGKLEAIDRLLEESVQ